MNGEKSLKHRLINLLSREIKKEEARFFDFAVLDKRVRSIFELRIGINYT
ncbi:hypothetical protein P9858_12480 [Niallia circulans]|nr:hypothetical protein [Niallia circulans]